MQAEDRIIHVSTELLHPPAPKNPAALRKLYYELSETRAAYDSTDFSAPGQVRFHSRRGKQTQSIALFMPDRIVLIEEWADIALIDFLEKVRIVGVQAIAACGIEFFGVERMMFASYMPFGPEGGAQNLRSTLAAVDELQLHSEQKHAMLHKNAKRIFYL